MNEVRFLLASEEGAFGAFCEMKERMFESGIELDTFDLSGDTTGMANGREGLTLDL